MENREQQILSEIKSMMGTIRAQLEMLDAKMAELQQCVDPDEFDNNPIELEIDDVAVDVVTDDVVGENVAVQEVMEMEEHEEEPESVPEYDDEEEFEQEECDIEPEP